MYCALTVHARAPGRINGALWGTRTMGRTLAGNFGGACGVLGGTHQDGTLQEFH